jgi:serine/threonine protein kinase
MRTALFLSYSKGDPHWRDLFVRHLKTMLLVGKELWVDLASIEDGSEWREQITRALPESRCALLLVTPNYLEKGRFSREELSMLAAEQSAGLTLLPVLVEPCAWREEPTLSRVQFVRWWNPTTAVSTGAGEHEDIHALSEAGDDASIDRAVITICERVIKSMGVVGQTTPEERDDLFEATKLTLGSTVTLQEPVHSGDFSVVYRGKLGTDTVAVKAVPDAVRRNRVRTLFDSVLQSLTRLRDPAFIRVHFHVVDREPHCVVMEYIDWPTLDEELAKHPGRRLAPATVARVLSIIARAQGDAHRCGVQIGPMSPENIHVSENWEIRLSPLRIEGQLARAAGLTTGQLMNWEILASLPPEICDGHQPNTPAELDALEQYYLGMLGLELLLGRKPFEIRRFDDLKLKSSFFEDPRAFFGDASPEPAGWPEESPALAYILARLLSRSPEQRLPSADNAAEELGAVADGVLPRSLRRQLERDLEDVASEQFTASFYDRLFRIRPSIRSLFRNPDAQPRMLAEALQDLVDFRPEAMRSRFLDRAKQHAHYGIKTEDVEAFRQAFLEQITAVSPWGRTSADAWNAALKIGLAVLAKNLP